jgi:DtxR family Mn-dependent transcriptional regulator
MTPMQQRKREELLQAIFTERERGNSRAEGILEHAGDHAPDRSPRDFAELAEAGLVRFDGTQVELTAEGDERAREVVRRHRLAERLFRDLLALDEGVMNVQACELEHILSPEATESVCTLLGHPPTCPHGKAIPPGACCEAFQKTIRPLVTRLESLELGAAGRIVFIAPKFHDRMDQLAALGVIPGSDIRLRQRSPAYVVEVGETTIALDPEIAGEIYVKRVEG